MSISIYLYLFLIKEMTYLIKETIDEAAGTYRYIRIQ